LAFGLVACSGATTSSIEDAVQQGAAMDAAPSIDAGGGGSTVDATTPGIAADASAFDVAVGAPWDASSADHHNGADAPADAPSSCMDAEYDGSGGGGVRCGGGCYPVVYCNGATPVCCQTTSKGTTAFQCTSSEAACKGYPIACANENDCPGANVCCRSATRTACAASCTSTGDIACVPGSPGDCPEGESCDRLVTNAGVAAPYYTCGDD
jgi:hypothetical protein